MRREQRCCVTPPRNLLKGKKKASLLPFVHSATWNSPQMGQAPSTILDQENEGHNSESGKQSWKNPSLWWLWKLPTTPGCFPPRPLFLWKHKSLGVQTTVLGSLLLSAKQSSSLIQHHKMSLTCTDEGRDEGHQMRPSLELRNPLSGLCYDTYAFSLLHEFK